MTGIVKIEGIGKVYAEKLAAAGIKTTEKLLEVAFTAKARGELEAKAGIPHKLILEWVNLADLLRIKGVGEEYSDLLEEAGVDTIAEFANRNAENLFAKILETNKEKKLVRRPPVLKQVQKWIEEAKRLPHKVEYYYPVARYSVSRALFFFPFSLDFSPNPTHARIRTDVRAHVCILGRKAQSR